MRSTLEIWTWAERQWKRNRVQAAWAKKKKKRKPQNPAITGTEESDRWCLDGLSEPTWSLLLAHTMYGMWRVNVSLGMPTHRFLHKWLIAPTAWWHCDSPAGWFAWGTRTGLDTKTERHFSEWPGDSSTSPHACLRLGDSVYPHP